LRCEQTGELVLGRCKSANLCEQCARLAAVEDAEMLGLDAIDGRGPEVYVVLTTRSTVQEQASYQVARQEFVRELRREFGRDVEYACLLEFTTGRGVLSGGERRPHWNYLLKGVGVEDMDRVRACVERSWCRLEDADPKAQHVGSVYAAGGLMKYLALHFLKQSQQPPEGWRGQRFNCSRNYFAPYSRRVARQHARESIRWKRELWRAREHGAADPSACADAECCAARDLVWCLCNHRGTRLSSTCFDRRRLALNHRGPPDRARERGEHASP